MKRSVRIFLLAAALVASTAASAEPTDPAAARELLKRGFALRKEGNYSEALGRLTESFRLDHQVKTLINIADCEERLGLLSRAQEHWVAARDQATTEGNAALLTEANKRLIAVESRMPKLTIKPPDGTIEGLEIRRDGVLLLAGSLGIPLPADPGPHQITVTAGGFADRHYTVDLQEGDDKLLPVEPGMALEATRPAIVKVHPAPRQGDVAPVTSRPSAGAARVQRTLAFGAIGAGSVGFGLAAFTWAQAVKDNHQAIESCGSPRGCTSSLRFDALANANRTTGLLLTGGALVILGGVLLATIPSERTGAGVSLAPRVNSSGAGLTVDGKF